ncbi:hypothetical protein OLMES_0453 [Oleiphilus messinensis]|uniref:Immunity MXAN-0049 protein domain-containing protein n=1 Tax=Oleiphilus messinensis TaxID=141451 RepID=A0A1Y0I261_9GAMM|nr:DUF1629 domain-containing protein [Oleiphilus messinensis]ARU54557.1 hypothetical protein OLMES_0453 [Oleiphilus messinensis]
MFYRFLSKLATQERLEVFPVPLKGSSWEKPAAWIPYMRDYEEKFNPIQLSKDTSGVNLFQAPYYTESGSRGLRLRYHVEKAIEKVPDIWGIEGRLIVSEKFKRVLESVDDMHHEYISIEIIDWNETTITTDQPYYWFNQRRFLTIDPFDRVVNHMEVGFCPIPGEEDFMARVLETQCLRELLEQFPIWQHIGLKGMEGRMSQVRCLLYMNQKLVDALEAVNVTGMDKYSQKYGIGEESLCEI